MIIKRISPNSDYPDPALRLERIGTPYTPRRLEELGRLPEIPECPPSFVPEAGWRGTFRIFGGHGFVGVRELSVGYLTIETMPEGEYWTAQISQRVVYAGGIVHTISARVVCKSEMLLPLESWEFESRITRTDGTASPDLDLNIQCGITHGVLHRTINGQDSELPATVPIMADWTLFAAVQRLPFAVIEPAVFDLADGLSVVKRNHAISFCEKHVERLEASGLELRSFYQIGSGTLPYEYWLDPKHRLIAAITGNRAYLLDDGAEDAFDKNVRSLRKGDGYVC